MNKPKEDKNANNTDENTLSEIEKMDITPDEYTINESGSGSSQIAGSSSDEIKNNPENNEVKVPALKVPPMNIDIEKPSCSKDKSNIRLTWESKKLKDSSNSERDKTVSMNTIVTLPYQKIMDSVKAYFEKKPDFDSKNTTTMATQTTPPSPHKDFNMQYDYYYPSDFDDDDSD